MAQAPDPPESNAGSQAGPAPGPSPPPVQFPHGGGSFGQGPFFNVGAGRYVPTSVRRKLMGQMFASNGNTPQLMQMDVHPSYLQAMLGYTGHAALGGW